MVAVLVVMVQPHKHVERRGSTVHTVLSSVCLVHNVALAAMFAATPEPILRRIVTKTLVIQDITL